MSNGSSIQKSLTMRERLSHVVSLLSEHRAKVAPVLVIVVSGIAVCLIVISIALAISGAPSASRWLQFGISSSIGSAVAWIILGLSARALA